MLLPSGKISSTVSIPGFMTCVLHVRRELNWAGRSCVSHRFWRRLRLPSVSARCNTRRTSNFRFTVPFFCCLRAGRWLHTFLHLLCKQRLQLSHMIYDHHGHRFDVHWACWAKIYHASIFIINRPPGLHWHRHLRVFQVFDDLMHNLLRNRQRLVSILHFLRPSSCECELRSPKLTHASIIFEDNLPHGLLRNSEGLPGWKHFMNPSAMLAIKQLKLNHHTFPDVNCCSPMCWRG
mmetsp:Transcript_4701/g.11409  ORF Transcript_4701/g.11409 Transcript_4701/m.11409 type:complete len:235 (+) Transcript_4701:167-871(+)